MPGKGVFVCLVAKPPPSYAWHLVHRQRLGYLPPLILTEIKSLSS
jgi:hypothetical protein